MSGKTNIFVTLFAAAILSFGCSNLPAQESANPNKIVIAWDAPTTNEDGTPLTDLSHYTVAISEETVDLNVEGDPLQTANVNCDQSTCNMRLNNIENLEDGKIRIWCRAVDTSGNVSVWSNYVEIRLDSINPNAPVITIMIEDTE